MDDGELLKQIGCKIAYYRKLYGMNQEQFAQKLFISKEKLKQIETGDSNVSVITINTIAKEFGVDLHKFFDFDLRLRH